MISYIKLTSVDDMHAFERRKGRGGGGGSGAATMTSIPIVEALMLSTVAIMAWVWI